jgi:oligoribonuclease NrnB/cAMP/cGMP phosphodiesterase (DHH superfamily)
MDLQKLKTAKVVKVIYHGGCKDGWTAAFTVYWLYLQLELRDQVKIELIPENHSFAQTKKLEDDLKSGKIKPEDTALIFADIAPGRETLLRLDRSPWAALYVVDHHKTTIEDSGDLPFFIWAYEESGASLMWLACNLPELTGNQMPHLHRLIRCLDIHRRDYPDWEELGMAIDMVRKDIRAWTWLYYAMEDNQKRQELVETGRPLVRYRDRVCGMIVRSAKPYWIKLNGHKGLASNSSIFSSVIADKMWKHCDFYCSYSFNGKMYYWSIRSSETGPDCSAIAGKYGGGGHARASGFRVASLDDLDLELLTEGETDSLVDAEYPEEQEHVVSIAIR